MHFQSSVARRNKFKTIKEVIVEVLDQFAFSRLRPYYSTD